MGDSDPVARVTGRPVARIFAAPKPHAVGIGAGIIAGGGAALGGVGGTLPGVNAAAGAVGVGIVAGLFGLCAIVGVTARRDTDEVRFYRSELVVEGRSAAGDGRRTIPYDEVDLVVRRAGGNTGTYELVRSGTSPVVLRSVTDPRTVERVLWRQWPSDTPLPDSPIVGEAAYRRALGGHPTTVSEDPDWEGHTATVGPSETNTEELASGRYSEYVAGESVGEQGYFGKEKVGSTTSRAAPGRSRPGIPARD